MFVLIIVVIAIVLFITGRLPLPYARRDSADDVSLSNHGSVLFQVFSQGPRIITVTLALATIAELNQQLRFQYNWHYSKGVATRSVIDKLTDQKDVIYSDECDN